MSWSLSVEDKGTKVAESVIGLMEREQSRWPRSRFELNLMDAHKQEMHVFATMHPHDHIRVTSYGHFSPDGSGNATVKFDVIESDELDPSGTPASTGDHSPLVGYGVTTPDQTETSVQHETEPTADEGAES